MPIGIRLSHFENAPSRESARRSIGLPVDSPVVAYVGKVARNKGISEFLEAMQRLAREGTQGIVVGEGPLRLEAEGVRAIRCYGTQPNERIPLYMAAADVLVLPSYSEGLPTVLVEAGAVGIPVIATSVGGIPELLGSDRGVLIPPRSSDALVEAIRAALTDRRTAAERTERLRRYVIELYDADRNALRLLELYEALLRAPARPRPEAWGKRGDASQTN
jgi:teichuronic acid biosynthesis glycosyltransferase TuaC